MQCLKSLIIENQNKISKFLIIISIILLIENLSIIIIVLKVLLNLKIYFQLYLLYLFIFSLLFIFFIIALVYFNRKNILFINKKNFTILSSYLFLAINIILISVIFGELFYGYKNDNTKFLFKENRKMKYFKILIMFIYNSFNNMINNELSFIWIK